MIHNIGTNLRKFRTEKGMSLQMLSNEIGVSAASIWRWEAGYVYPRMVHLQNVVDVVRFFEDPDKAQQDCDNCKYKDYPSHSTVCEFCSVVLDCISIFNWEPEED